MPNDVGSVDITPEPEYSFSEIGGIKFASADGYGNPQIVDAANLIDPKDREIVPYVGSGTSDPGIAPQSIIGVDERYRILDTTKYPYSAIVHLENSFNACTGWMVSWDTIVTAGHCIFNRDAQEFASEWRIIPGRSSGNYPFGVYTSSHVTLTHVDADYIIRGTRTYDWGLIKLNAPIGNETGWFGLLNSEDKNSLGELVSLTGFPGDYKGVMMSMMGYVTGATPEALCYSIDTMGGQSGSPVYLSTKQVVAIHAYAVGSLCAAANGAVLITEDSYHFIIMVALSEYH
ncbi:MAG: trypsin-like serine protease [Propionibacteriaceae bacterium]|jgi:glutamyl endopeptidase|nr:trypsin-like serine protease [Propionibacteriaceae bacterium]